MAPLVKFWLLTWKQMVGEGEEVLGIYDSEEEGQAAGRDHAGPGQPDPWGEYGDPFGPFYYLQELTVNAHPWRLEEEQK